MTEALSTQEPNKVWVFMSYVSICRNSLGIEYFKLEAVFRAKPTKEMLAKYVGSEESAQEIIENHTGPGANYDNNGKWFDLEEHLLS